MQKFLVILCFCFAACQMQAQSPLDIRINLTINNETLESTLFQLVDKEDINLSFSNNLIPQGLLVSGNFQNVRLEKVLQGILSQTELTFVVIEDEILLVRRTDVAGQKFTISGFVTDQETGESLVGANIFAPDLGIGTTTNEFGFYSLNLPAKAVKTVFSYLGYEREIRQLQLRADRKINVALKISFLTEILVVPNRDSFLLKSSLFGAESINMDEAEVLPSLGGETDVVRALFSLPGVNAGADGFGNLSVRGGNIDQNLFLLDGVPIYNPVHAVGVFSVFNSSAIRSATFLRGVFPAKYGGRLSSVLDVQTREGSKKSHITEVDLGLTSLKLSVEGPIKKKTSFFASGRRALFDFYSVPVSKKLRQGPDSDGFVSYFFYDFNLKVNHQFSEKDRVYLSFYNGADNFFDEKNQTGAIGDTLVFFGDKDDLSWGNTVASLRWNKTFGNQLFGNLTATFTRFFYKAETLIDLNAVYQNDQVYRDVLFYDYESENQDIALKMDFDYRPNARHLINFGIHATQHEFHPGIISFRDAASFDSIGINGVGDFNPVRQEAYEYDAYVQDEVKISEYLHANIGFRVSALLIDDYWKISPQPRILLHFLPNNRFSIKAAGGRHTQNIHLLTSSSFGLPRDLWVSATRRRPPQQSWQTSLGFDVQLNQDWNFSVDGYFKNLENLITIPESLLDNIDAQSWENSTFSGKGKAYGVEFLLRKETGKTTGWLGYTYSRSTRIFEQTVNRGEEFPIRLDRPHNLNVQIAHRFNKKWSASVGWQFASGSAFTLPTREYELDASDGGSGVVIEPIVIQDIEEKHGNRLPDYHRLDLGFSYRFAKGKIAHSIKFGTYNTYNRKNPIYRSTRDRLDRDGIIKTELVQVTLFPIFPSLRYRVLFL